MPSSSSSILLSQVSARALLMPLPLRRRMRSGTFPPPSLKAEADPELTYKALDSNGNNVLDSVSERGRSSLALMRPMIRSRRYRSANALLSVSMRLQAELDPHTLYETVRARHQTARAS